MKYMGSKSSMLRNGLGELLLEQSQQSNRFFDPFCGSAVVSWFVAEKTNVPVYSSDLQKYSYYLSESIIGRGQALTSDELQQLRHWVISAKRYRTRHRLDIELKHTKKFVTQNRALSTTSDIGFIKAYGGYYYCFDQALAIEYLLRTIPDGRHIKTVAMAALIEAASLCAASPGHTAQPFQPENEKGLKAIIEAWKRDPLELLERKVTQYASRYAQTPGNAIVGDSLELLGNLEEGDLVFLDPPYSGVHYSRFYHVLESIAREGVEEVSGRGRYPAPEERPRSDFSLKGKSKNALDQVFDKIATRKAKAIITFPNAECSNGLSGEDVKQTASRHFRVTRELIKGRFSTLGGNNVNRPARHESEELVLLLEPRNNR